VKYEFTIVLHDRDRALLENVQLFFNGIGGIDKHGKSSSKYRVSSIKDISKIIDHFDKYPLLTQKRANYLLFKRAFERLVIAWTVTRGRGLKNLPGRGTLP
jgi:hypothetical protein